MHRRHFTLATAATLAAPFARAQTAWPERPVKVLIPNAPGSSVDTIGRIACTTLAANLPQPLVIDNRAGAAGALGVELARTAAPDGQTLLVGSSSAVTVAPLLQKAVTYQPLRDFDFLSLLAVLPNVLVVHPALPVRDIAQFVAWAKGKGNDGSRMASAGIGSVSHLAGVALASAAGFNALHVPYRGGAQGVASVVSGETDWVLTPAPAAMGLVQAGRLRLLGHSMAPSTKPLGDTPSLGSTLTGFEFSSWIGLTGPKGLPPRVGETLRRQLPGVLARPELRQSFEQNGAQPQASTAEQFRDFVARDIEVTRKAVQLAGVVPE